MNKLPLFTLLTLALLIGHLHAIQVQQLNFEPTTVYEPGVYFSSNDAKFKIAENYTFAFRVYWNGFNTNSDRAYIFHNKQNDANGFALFLDQSLGLSFETNSDIRSTGWLPENQTWYDIVVTYEHNTGAVKIIQNKEILVNSESGAKITPTTDAFYIGNKNSPSSDFQFLGELSNILISNTVTDTPLEWSGTAISLNLDNDILFSSIQGSGLDNNENISFNSHGTSSQGRVLSIPSRTVFFSEGDSFKLRFSPEAGGNITSYNFTPSNLDLSIIDNELTYTWNNYSNSETSIEMVFSDNTNHQDIDKINLNILPNNNLTYLNYFDKESTFYNSYQYIRLDSDILTEKRSYALCYKVNFTKFSTYSHHNFYFSDRHAMVIYFNGINKRIYFEDGHSSQYISWSPVLNTTYNLVFVHDDINNKILFYVDGSLHSELDFNQKVSTSNYMELGNRGHYHVKMRDIQIYAGTPEFPQFWNGTEESLGGGITKLFISGNGYGNNNEGINFIQYEGTRTMKSMKYIENSRQSVTTSEDKVFKIIYPENLEVNSFEMSAGTLDLKMNSSGVIYYEGKQNTSGYYLYDILINTPNGTDTVSFKLDCEDVALNLSDLEINHTWGNESPIQLNELLNNSGIISYRITDHPSSGEAQIISDQLYYTSSNSYFSGNVDIGILVNEGRPDEEHFTISMSIQNALYDNLSFHMDFAGDQSGSLIGRALVGPETFETEANYTYQVSQEALGTGESGSIYVVEKLPDTSFTIIGTVRNDQFTFDSNDQPIIRNDIFSLKIINSNKLLQLDIDSPFRSFTLNSTTAFHKGEWHTFAIIYDHANHNLKLLVDGIVEAEQYIEENYLKTTDQFSVVGAENYSIYENEASNHINYQAFQGYFRGHFASLRQYSYALSEEDLYQLSTLDPEIININENDDLYLSVSGNASLMIPNYDFIVNDLLEDPSHGTLTVSDNKMYYQAPFGFVGSDSFVLDSGSESGLKVNINVLNRLPWMEDIQTSINNDDSLSYTLNGTDPDDHSLSYSLVGNPDTTLGTPSITNNTLNYQSNNNVSGYHNFEIEVFDGHGVYRTQVRIQVIDNQSSDLVNHFDFNELIFGSDVVDSNFYNPGDGLYYGFNESADLSGVSYVYNEQGGTAIQFANGSDINAHIENLDFLDFDLGRKFTLETSFKKSDVPAGDLTFLEVIDNDIVDPQEQVRLKWWLDSDGYLKIQLLGSAILAQTQNPVYTNNLWSSYAVVVDLDGATPTDMIQIIKDGSEILTLDSFTVNASLPLDNIVPHFPNLSTNMLVRETSYELLVDYMRIVTNVGVFSNTDLYGGESYISGNASASVLIPGQDVLKRTKYSMPQLNSMNDNLKHEQRLSLELYDRHPQVPGVFHGVFEINFALQAQDFTGMLYVDVLIQKPGDVFKKISEISVEIDDQADIQWIHHFWDSRAVAFDWGEVDAEPYQTNDEVQLKFVLR